MRPECLKGVVTMQEEQNGGMPWALHFLRLAFIGLLTAAILCTIGGSVMAASTAQTVIPMGRAVGIKLFSDGVLVVGFSEIPTDDGKRLRLKTAA